MGASDDGKRALEAWEKSTAEWLEAWLRSPLALDPAGSAFAVASRAKRLAGRALGRAWAGVGLSTKRDQDRALHVLRELESKLLDLEEKLETLEKKP